MTGTRTASAPEGRRARNRRLKMEAALEAALRLIEADGIDGLTIGRLASELDWAIGAMYRYFESKDALLVALQARIVDEYAADAEAVVATAPDPLAALARTALHYHDYFMARRGQFALVATSLSHPRQLIDDATGADHFARVLTMLQRVVQRFVAAADAGVFAPGNPGERMLVLWSALTGVMQLGKLRRMAPELIETRRLVVASTSALFIGFGADEAAVAAAFEIPPETGVTR